MHLRVIAVGDKQPAWVESAVTEYAGRLPRQWRFELKHIPAVQRSRGSKDDSAKQNEGRKILDTLRASEFMVLLDERGKSITSRELSGKLDNWQAAGRDVCFVIGGADGVSDECRQRADYVLSLSAMTLPHGLARVLFVEQLYRAWTIQERHPYHRD